MRIVFITSLCMILCGCANVHDSIITSTTTLVGVEVDQNPTTQLYQAKLGVARNELAFVPTDRATNQIGGAASTGDVIFEFSLRNIFAGGGVYQRLAIGKNAVSQPGTAFLFAKDQNGSLTTNAIQMLQQNLPMLLNHAATH